MGLLLGAGGRMIDTSPMYGRAETVIGDLLAGFDAPPRVFLATKVWTTGRERGIEQMRRSAQLLRTEVIDLMQIHNLVDWRTHLAGLFLKYILAEPAVTCVIPATRSPTHIKDDLEAGLGKLPDARQRQQIRQLWDAL